MKEINQAYLTGNPDIDKYLSQNPNMELHDTLDLRSLISIWTSSWYRHLARHLTTQQFQDYIHHRYPYGYKAYLDHLTKEMVPYDSFEAAVTDSSLWDNIEAAPNDDRAHENLKLINKINNLTSTAYEITLTFVSNHIWLDQIVDYCMFEDLYSRKRTFEIVKTIVQTAEDPYLFAKLSYHQEKSIQVLAQRKLEYPREYISDEVAKRVYEKYFRS